MTSSTIASMVSTMNDGPSEKESFSEVLRMCADFNNYHSGDRVKLN